VEKIGKKPGSPAGDTDAQTPKPPQNVLRMEGVTKRVSDSVYGIELEKLP